MDIGDAIQGNVIAFSHLGINASCTPWTSSEVIENTSGIDVFLDGHSHSVAEGDTVNSSLVSGDIQADAKTQEYIEKINTEFEDILNEVVAKTDVALVVNNPETADQEET